MEENIHNTGNLLLIGDINIKINVENDPGTMIFNIQIFNILDSFSLAKTVNFKTQHQDNTLDLEVQDAGAELIVCSKEGHLVLDHNLVLFDVTLPPSIIDKSLLLFNLVVL